MRKSGIAIGQMFLHFNPTYMDRPRVWVKTGSRILGDHYGEDKEEVSLFVDNNALLKKSVNPSYEPDLPEKWLVTDTYYGKMVREGEFVPIDDLNKVVGITEQLGWPAYVMDF